MCVCVCMRESTYACGCVFLVVHRCAHMWRERKEEIYFVWLFPNSLHLEAVCFSVDYSEHPGCGPPGAIPELLHSPNLPPRPWGGLRLPEKLRLREGMWFVAVFPDGSNSKESSSMQETRVQFLGQEDPLEKGIQHSCLEKSLGQRSLEGYSPRGCKELDTPERPTLYLQPVAG